ncbi:putative serine/threonine-protein kinase Cx32 [Nymphaea thermarum]|nr:putative serine/threonine-protein kinase Cx32 [Nymphaea thermarum]
MGNCLRNQKAPSLASGPSSVTPTSGTSTSKTSSSGTRFSSSTGDSVAVFSGDEAAPEGQILPVPNLKEFTFAELKAATKGFRPDSLLGEGGFGRVFKGWVDERTLAPAKSGAGINIAVKKLNPESMQGFQEWQSEINFLGRLSHPNLVKLLGYCFDDNELLLVYEYMQRGNLENHLFRRSSAVEPLSWRIRLKILIGAGRGLAFLHQSDRQIIYRDFKASNILLDPNYNAKISDFGLAKHGPMGGDSHVTTRVMGTHGYAAPEYVATGHLYVKSDVYGFGVVLLEMMTGKRALDTRRPSGQTNLVDWMKPILGDRRKLLERMDARLDGKYPKKAAIEAAKVAAKCLEPEPKSRPHMKEVVEALERIAAIKEKPRNAKSVNSNEGAPAPAPPLNGQFHYRHHYPSPRRSPLHPNMESPGNGIPQYQRSPMHRSPLRR